MHRTIRNTEGLGLAIRRVIPVALGFLSGIGVFAASPFNPEGSQYQAAGSPVGDQLSPALAFRSTGGWLAWHDNSTDGVGFGVSARRLTGQLTGLSSFRVSETTAGDQENAQIVQLLDGGALVVWQSGEKGSQVIMGRVIKSDGKFAGNEFQISNLSVNNREPSVAINKDGNVLVVWSSEGPDGNMLGVQGRLLNSAGSLEGEPVVINQFAKYHQRSPALSSLVDGSFIVAWVSEQQRSENTVDIYARKVSATGVPVQDEYILNATSRPCATPAVAGLPNGGFLATWSEHDYSVPGATWDVVGRVYGPSGPLSSPTLVNTRRIGFQGMPKLAVVSDSVLVVYLSEGGDGYSFGVSAQWLALNGDRIGDEFVVNTKTAGDQMTPTVASDGENRAVAVWSTFSGSSRGMDLAGQRFSRAVVPLDAPGMPFVFAVSPSRLFVSFPELSGLPVKQYELYVNGSDSPIVLTTGSHALTGLPPNSSQVIRLAYVLQDGRRSPMSLPASGTTWGEDGNADGLPDDWQTVVYGPDSASWPSPSSDSDSDGVSDREEFLAGTDPKSAESVLRTSITSTEQGVLLTWNSRAGAIYQVQGSNNLKDWTNIGAARLAAGTSDSIPIGDQPNNIYYRINILR